MIKKVKEGVLHSAILLRSHGTKLLKNSTDCCALAHISGINNYTPVEAIEELLDAQKNEALGNRDVFYGKDSGQTCLFSVVTMPNETPLYRNLIKLGYKDVHNFARRVGYPEGRNHLLIKNVI